ncbi:hypothetical protein [Wukongibacter sp. M2B1]|uniref:hypothetical protein n=1 Tax=Wukongibacter sp. M2B1 TaxID=3088895 RepID=UPI003D7AFADA
MSNVLYEYGWIMILVVGAVGYFYWVYKKQGKKNMLIEMREKAYALMLLAEKRFDTGEEKFDWVAEKLYIAIPNSAKIIFSQEDIEDLIQEIYENLGDFLDDGQLNKSFNH